MNILYKPIVLKQLQKIPKSDQKKVLAKIQKLATQPLLGKKLKGELEDLRSYRSWPYRIIYQWDGSHVTVFSVAHRQTAYQ